MGTQILIFWGVFLIFFMLFLVSFWLCGLIFVFGVFFVVFGVGICGGAHKYVRIWWNISGEMAMVFRQYPIPNDTPFSYR